MPKETASFSRNQNAPNIDFSRRIGIYEPRAALIEINRSSV